MQCLWFLLTLYVCQSTEWSSHISRFFHFLCLWTWERFWSIRTSSFLNHSFLLTWLYSLISLAPSGAFLLAVPLKSCCCAVLTHIYLGPEGLSAVFFFFLLRVAWHSAELNTQLHSLIPLPHLAALFLGFPLNPFCCAVPEHVYLLSQNLSLVLCLFVMDDMIGFWIKHSISLSNLTCTLRFFLSWLSSQALLLYLTETHLSCFPNPKPQEFFDSLQACVVTRSC